MWCDNEEKGKTHPNEGKEGSTTEKKRKKRNSTSRRRPGSTAQQKTREMQLHREHRPKEAKQHHTTEDKGESSSTPYTTQRESKQSSTNVPERGSHADIEIDVKVQPYVQPEMLKLCQREGIFASDQHGCSLARRDETTPCLPGRPTSVFSVNQQQLLHVQLLVDQVKEMERLIAAANCLRYFEIIKKPNKFKKFNTEFPSFQIENQFLSCFGRFPSGTEKVSETRDINNLSVQNT